jgi:predicted dehydrogenase
MGITKAKFRVLIVGCGNMGSSHVRAYSTFNNCIIVGLVAPTAAKRHKLSIELGGIPEYADFYVAMEQTNPDIVCIATYPQTHAQYAIYAMTHGAHVFLEKPIATTIEDALEVIKTAELYNKKLVIGLILQQHPSWQKFIHLAQTLGNPLVMRMNLNQQSIGTRWDKHKKVMQTISPIVDCGVHYVDVMCQMTKAKPISVYAIGAKLSSEIPIEMYNYGCLQIRFDDGSVGWYEAAWGPMISTTAHFIKDVIGPNGSVSIVPNKDTLNDSADINLHTATDLILLHKVNNTNEVFDEIISMEDEPDHQELCRLEQSFLLKAISNNINLSDHLNDAINCLKIVLAADVSIKTNTLVNII